MIVPSLVTNVWQAVVGGALTSLLRRLWTLLVTLCLGVWIGTGMLARADAVLLSGVLGLLVCLYAAAGLMTPRIPSPGRREVWLSPAMGIATGVTTGLTGSFVVGVPYLQALGLQRDALIQAMGILFCISTIALAVALTGNDMLPRALGIVSAIAVAPAILGMMAGQWARSKISEQRFRQVLLVGLLALGAYLAYRGFI